jgi:methyl-accepting chemotaxis protein
MEYVKELNSFIHEFDTINGGYELDNIAGDLKAIIHSLSNTALNNPKVTEDVNQFNTMSTSLSDMVRDINSGESSFRNVRDPSVSGLLTQHYHMYAQFHDQLNPQQLNNLEQNIEALKNIQESSGDINQKISQANYLSFKINQLITGNSINFSQVESDVNKLKDALPSLLENNATREEVQALKSDVDRLVEECRDIRTKPHILNQVKELLKNNPFGK